MNKEFSTDKFAVYAKKVLKGENNPNGYNYTPCKTWQQLIIDNNIFIIEDEDSMYGWSVKQYDIDHNRILNRPIYLQQQKHKYGKTISYAYVYIWDFKNNKGKQIALHTLIYLNFVKDVIPEGYVIDHINNDSLDNRPENLRCITRQENAKKSSGNNQYTYLKKLNKENEGWV